jgi:diaminohydroxyphosphoribosylaminopyrimidine deaminase/5-amino-6-(5-phosphoribosylamino)uracil reductase
MKFSQEDLTFMEMAYSLAEKAKGNTSPNPCVGAVIVNQKKIVGWGYHQEAGQPHAEIIALEKAGQKVKGATLYLTLEPCVHWGRTPPCVDRLIGAGLKRVVISSYDPNPLVYKKGVSRLKRAGIEVITGLLSEKNDKLNEAYNKYILSRKPFVCLKAAISLDGKIATVSGDSRWISSEESRHFVQNLRAEYDAILVGINTIIKDDPLLTIRLPGFSKRNWHRVILDSELRLPLNARLLKDSEGDKIIIFTGKRAPHQKAEILKSSRVEIIRVNSRHGQVDLREVLKELGKREISSLLVEGGAQVLTSFIEQKLADKAFFFLSPKLIGGEKALTPLEGQGVSSISKAIRLKNCRHFSLQQDIIIEGYF